MKPKSIPNNQKHQLIRIIILQLIPIIGLLFFGWKLFDLGLLYLLESMAIFFVFNFHQYFIRKKTRYPIPFALIQLAFALIFFGGLLFGYIVVIYAISGEQPGVGHFEKTLFPRLVEYNLPFVFSIVMLLEFISFYTKLSKDSSQEEFNFPRVMKRLLYTHLLIIASLGLIVFAVASEYLAYIAFMLLKTGFEFAMDHPVYLKRFKNWILQKKQPT